MKLRYYLRGLGIGMLVAALVLVLSGDTGGKMSDEEVKQRAMQLGMVEKDTSVLVESITKKEESGAGTEAETGTEAGTKADTESEQEAGAEAGTEAGAGAKAGSESSQKASAGSETENESAQGASAKTETEQENTEKTETDKNGQEADTASASRTAGSTGQETGNTAGTAESSETADQENQGTDEAAQRAEEVAEQGTEAAENAPAAGVVTFVVKSGDSSVSVARRAQEMGLVESADEFDNFLCRNGYDRRISVGSYQISAQASMKEIADKITRS